jgi:hypothetical protein
MMMHTGQETASGISQKDISKTIISAIIQEMLHLQFP